MISSQQIYNAAKDLSYNTNFLLPSDIKNALKSIYKKEKNIKFKQFLNVLLENARIAKQKKLALCQDTGIPLIFLEIGSEIYFSKNLCLHHIIENAIRDSYRENYLRDSTINDPLIRNKVIQTKPIIYSEFTKGKNLKMSMILRGAGCENTTQLKMFNPDVEIKEIEKFILNTVEEKILYCCPPVTVGIGIGGDASKSVLLSKKTFFRTFSEKVLNNSSTDSNVLFYKKLEKKLLEKINRFGTKIFGKTATTLCLKVFIEHSPCHIASLPVTVSMQCHSYRRDTKIL